MVNHESAKYHAKAKTKHLRLGFLLFLFDSLRTASAGAGGAQGAPWPQFVDVRALTVSIAIGEYFDRIDALLSEFFAQFTREEGEPVDVSQSRPAEPTNPNVRQHLVAILGTGAAVL